MSRPLLRRRIFRSALAGTAIVLLAACSSSDEVAQPLDLTILHINDTHSRLDSEPVSLRLANAAGTREAINLEYGGFARITSAIKSLSTGSPNVLKLHAGDMLTGDLYYNLNAGKAEADLMNTACFDAFAIGNHEFDNGDAGLKTFVDFLQAGACKTPVLSANVTFGANSPLATNNPVRRSAVVSRSGQQIGIVGLTVASKTMNASRPSSGTVIGDELPAAQAEIDRLRAQGIDKIVLLSHLGYDADRAIAPKLSGVDVIVGGDSHTLLGPDALKNFGLTPAGPYPAVVANKEGKTVCIVQAWQYGYVLGELKVSFDANGDVTRCAGTPHVLVGGTLKRGANAVTEPDLAAMLADLSASKTLRVTPADPVALAVLAPYSQAKVAFGSEVVGTAASNLCLRRVPGTKLDPTRSALGDTCNLDPNVIAHGGDIQQIVAQAFLQGARDFFAADLSIQNGGGVRADVRAGSVTVNQVYTVLPFKNTLVQLKATGAEIRAALEEAIEAVVIQKNTGGYPYTAGLRFDVDLNQAKGARLSNLQIRQIDGSLRVLDAAATYSVATTNFLADGGDFYATLKTITGNRRSEVGLDYAEVLLRYFQAAPGRQIAKLPIAEYSTQGFVDLR